MTILLNLLLGIWILVALVMILVILMQRPKSEGLGAAFGGAVTENIFGAQTTNVLVKFTGWLAGLFFLLTFFLSVLYAQRSMGGGADSELRRELLKKQTAPAVSATPALPQSAPALPAAPNAGSSVAPAGSSAPAASTQPSVSSALTPMPAPVVPAKSSPEKPKP